jgi:hypothetical protein
MVNVELISKQVKRHFRIKGTFDVNPQSGEVDVQGDVLFKGLITSQGRFHVQFGTVTGEFVCSDLGVVSLEGSPHTVMGDFFCQNARRESKPTLTSLQGAPRIVHGGFSCMHNLLTNLVGAPEQVGDWFACDHNLLTSLEGAPHTVGGNFSCWSNKLTNLEGGPTQVTGRYDCRRNPLKSLQGLPPLITDQLELDYKKDLPLLRLLNFPKKININAPKQVINILAAYKGQGKPGAIKAAVELIRAGFKENAKW